MRRIGNLWPEVRSLDNLLSAYRKARRGKADRIEVQGFALDLESRLFELQSLLDAGLYDPGSYRQFRIYERKPRIISAAPFVDRVVHHAVMNPLEPLLDRRFIHDSYACRAGKGVHRAVDRYQHWSRRYPYAMQLDIRRYFPSIDHRRLNAKLRDRIKDAQVLDLFAHIIAGWPPDGGQVGLPIGNLTSQFFANLYLDDFDHWVKQALGAKAYLRYVDDLVLLADSRGQLRNWRGRIAAKLSEDGLEIHDDEGGISPTREGLDLFGYRVWPHRRQLRNDNGWRFARRFRAMARRYSQGGMTLAEVRPSVASWIGHAMHGETLALRRKLLGGVVFRAPTKG